MRRIEVVFTDEEKDQLHYERFHHPHPRVQKKMEALWLKSQGLSHKEICRLVGICRNTLRSYINDFLEGGVEGLKRFDAKGTRSALDSHMDTLCEYFVENPPHTTNQARDVITRLTGIERSPTQVREFLKRAGFSRRKVGALPAKADVQAQEDFKKMQYSRV